MDVRIGDVQTADDLVWECWRVLMAVRSLVDAPGGEVSAREEEHVRALESLADAHRARAELWVLVRVPVPPDRRGRGGEFDQDTRYTLMRAAKLAEQHDLDEARRYEAEARELTGHSLRAGLATEARRAGHTPEQIADQGGWRRGLHSGC